MEQIRTNGEQKELRDEVVDLGTRYGIVTPYTSYLALEPNARPQDVVRFSGGNLKAPTGNAPPPSPKVDANAITGMAGVQQSKRARAQQETMVLEEKDAALSSAVKTVGGKTFYLREGVWTDAEFKAEAHLPETAVTFGSDEYFALLKQKARLAQFFSLGERIIVVFEGRVYRVTTTKP
jgi:Ca-activated chloride channel family protein